MQTMIMRLNWSNADNDNEVKLVYLSDIYFDSFKKVFFVEHLKTIMYL